MKKNGNSPSSFFPRLVKLFYKDSRILSKRNVNCNAPYASETVMQVLARQGVTRPGKQQRECSRSVLSLEIFV